MHRIKNIKTCFYTKTKINIKYVLNNYGVTFGLTVAVVAVVVVMVLATVVVTGPTLQPDPEVVALTGFTGGVISAGASCWICPSPDAELCTSPSLL